MILSLISSPLWQTVMYLVSAVLSFCGVYRLFLNENLGIIVSLSSFVLFLLPNVIAGFETLYILPSLGIAGIVLLGLLGNGTTSSSSPGA